MSARRIVAIVPMKPLYQTKTRLAGVLSEDERARLSLEMLRRVIAAAQDALGVVWVVGGDDAVRQAAERLIAVWREDPGKDLNDTLNLAVRQACGDGLTPLYLPADLPFLTADDVRKAALASDGGETLMLAPAQRDGGTNAILIPCHTPFSTTLGVDSFNRHKQQAASLGISYTVCSSDGLGMDLDTPEDLELCGELEPGFVDTIVSMATAIGNLGDVKD